MTKHGSSLVCVQGLGFVGAAMAVAIADAEDSQGDPLFQVVGLDLPTPGGLERIEALNQGRFPFAHSDPKLAATLEKAAKRGNLRADSDPAVLGEAQVVVIDVNLDISREQGAQAGVAAFEKAVETVARHMRPGSLVLVETTVPPGTCEKIVAPLLERVLAQRGCGPHDYLLAHSYERVMPGDRYLDSITNFWRVYAGHTPEAAEACQDFLGKVINTDKFPLTRLHSTTASELSKVLENSYRAMNIAFIEEWGRFAEEAGVDLYEVLRAIRVRPTHSNIRQPGFGVGGYCLTKDPLLAEFSAKELFGLPDQEFFFSLKALEVNARMPLVTLDKLDQELGGLAGKTILLLGVSYRQDVGDTRFSPAELFVRQAGERGAEVWCYDPMVSYWDEMHMQLPQAMPGPQGVDALVLAVPHQEFRDFDFAAWAPTPGPLFFDANDVLTPGQRRALALAGHRLLSIGRGEILP